MSIQPYRGATTASFYIEEVTAGTTPASPSWKPLRNTGGVPAVTRDALVSNELDGSRETTSIRTGNKQATGEFAIELSQKSQDDLLAGAMTNNWVAGISIASVTIAVDATAKTFTRSVGSFVTDGVKVGSLVAFHGLPGNNGLPFIATAVTATVVTGAGIQAPLTTAVAATTDLKTGDTLGTGNLCKTYSILTWFKGKCGTVDSYLLTTGVEFGGFSIELAVNAMVTGSFPLIGMKQQILTAPPTGSTFTQTFTAEPFASVDVAVFDGSAPLQLIDSLTFTNDNSASAQFALGSPDIAYVERGRAANTFSMTGKLYDMTLINRFLNETQTSLSAILTGTSGAMSFTMPTAEFTAATPEVSAPEAVTLSIEGQGTGNATQSSLVIQRLSYT
jgi:hypothetical protein